MLKIPSFARAQNNVHRFDSAHPARRDFPSWHFAMLNDNRRNKAIERAINDLPLEGKTVVEIGTGTGLIALMFARAGAERIFTCEMNANLVGIAQQIVDTTPYSDRITIIDRNSSEAISEGLLPIAPDYIFTETLDCGVVGEGYFDIARDIQKIAGAKTIVIPEEVRQIGKVVESKDFFDLNAVGDVCGFDLSVLNAFSTSTYFPVREQLYNYEGLSAPVKLRKYNYLSNTPAPTVTIEMQVNGIASGVMSWIEIQFGNHVLSNSPGTNSHWYNAFHPFEKPLKVSRGQGLEITIDDDGRAILDLIEAESCPEQSIRAI